MMLRACIDCGSDIIGERLRCTGCHERFANTFPDLAEREHQLRPSRLVALLVTSEVVAIFVLGFVMIWRAC